MKRHLRYCNNPKCPAYEELIDTNMKHCVVCDWRMKAFDHRNSEAFRDQPISGPALINGASIQRPALLTAAKEEAHVFSSNCDVEKCSIAPSGVVKIPIELYQRWIFLCWKFPTEWIAYLRGTKEKDGTYLLNADGMYFPTQRVQPAHVVADPWEEDAATIGSVHSHVDMMASFSGEDNANFSHDVEIVVNRRGQMSCVTRVQLKCGEFTRSKSEITLTGDEYLQSLIEDLTGKMTVERTTVTAGPQWTQNSGGDWQRRVYGDGASYDPKHYAKGQHGVHVVDKRHHAQDHVDLQSGVYKKGPNGIWERTDT